MDTLGDVYLKHLDPDYDPAKAREYYLRNRILKGRQKVVEVTPVGRSSKAAVKPGHVHNNTHKHNQKTTGPRPKSIEQKKKEVAAQVAGLKGRLEVLRKVLAELTKQAKARSGVETKSETPAGKGSKERAKQNGKQKAEAAKKSKEYYEKNKETETDLGLETKELEEKIADIQERIEEMKAKIVEARQKATTRKSSSVGARATTNK